MSDKVISLDKFRKKKNTALKENAVPGKLVWLYCPKCRSMQYTEVTAPNGRYHNKCGSMVEEAEVEVDLRAEATLAVYNMRRIDKLMSRDDFLKKHLSTIKHSEELYLKRTRAAAGFKVGPYTEDIEKIKDRLPIKERSELGLLISDFRYRPEKRFSIK